MPPRWGEPWRGILLQSRTSGSLALSAEGYTIGTRRMAAPPTELQNTKSVAPEANLHD